MQFVGTFWALVPPIIAITLALITKEAYSSLFIGVVIGALFIGNIRQNTRDAIVLPDTAQSVQSESQPDENKPALL